MKKNKYKLYMTTILKDNNNTNSTSVQNNNVLSGNNEVNNAEVQFLGTRSSHET